MQLTPIPRKSLSDALYEQLLDAIVDGKIGVGEALPSERHLAEQAGVNRQAVREALQRLRRAGLIRVVHGGGAYAMDWRRDADVATMSEFVADRDGRVREEPWADLMRLRSALQLDMAVLACRHGTDQQLDAIAAAVARIRQLHDSGMGPEGLMEYENLWALVAQAGGNIAYRLAHATFHEGTVRFGATLPATAVVADLVLQDRYDEFVAALRSRDEQAAREAARNVVRQTTQSLAGLDRGQR